MTSTDTPAETEDQRHEHEITIIVDGQKKTVSSDVVSYTEVVELAYPGQSADPQYTFTVTYRNSAEKKKHDGTLVPGQTVHVKKQGTVFNVTRTTKS